MFMRTALALVLLAFGCSNAGDDLENVNGTGDSSTGGDGITTDEGFSLDGTTPGCVNLECRQVLCEAGGKTTITGVVHEPAGKIPLYNVVVYVPNAKVDPFVDGASCDRCGNISGSPLVSAITDTKGKFVLENVPTGKDIPLVIQVGKWRRQIVIPEIKGCVDNPVDASQLRLPKNKSEGDIPKIAVTTGGADPLECLLRKIGVDDTEFGVKSGAQRIHLYAGKNGGGTKLASGTDYAPQADLWPDAATIKKYDILLLACEGAGEDVVGPDKPEPSRAAMLEYMNSGGRIFMSHLHKYWLVHGPAPLPTVATFVEKPDLPNPTTAFIDTSFPKGAALSEWMVNVGGSTMAGEFSLNQGQHTVDAVNMATSQRWIYGKTPESVMYYTFNTPIGTKPEEQCGRVVFSDIHVSSGDTPGSPFPSGCTTKELSAQEKALVFMLFDLSSCVNPDKERPKPPK
jgi:hypothetical protein